MSPYGRLMLSAAIGVGVAYAVFFFLMTDGLVLGTRSALFLGLSVLGFIAVIAIVTMLQQSMSKPFPKTFPDEREEFVEVKSDQMGYRVLETALFVVIGLAVYEAAVGPNALGSYSLNRPESIVFAIITVIAVAGMARLLNAVIQDR